LFFTRPEGTQFIIPSGRIAIFALPRFVQLRWNFLIPESGRAGNRLFSLINAYGIACLRPENNHAQIIDMTFNNTEYLGAKDLPSKRRPNRDHS
jgi:hypothetical protein